MSPSQSKQDLLHQCFKQASQDKTMWRKCLALLLTQAEIKDLEDRVAILQALHAGHTQREVAKNRKVSISKVIRGAAAYQKHKKLISDLLAHGQL